MAAPARFVVRKLDFNRGYVIVSTVTGRELARTWNTHRAPVAAQAARMNAKTRPSSERCPS